MKNILTLFILAAFLGAQSCSELLWPQEPGELTISFDKSFRDYTKSSGTLPQTDEFILTVTDASGKSVYDGKFGDSPESFTLSAGSYTVSAVSREFSTPLYETPQYGDTQVVSVGSGQSISVLLNCTQLNCGVRLVLDEYFRTAYPEGVLYLKGSTGTLMYGYSEKRTAYFKPGVLSVSLFNEGSESTICTRSLKAQDMLTLGLSAVPENEEGASRQGKIALQLDTCRNWISETLIPGGGSSDILSVLEARESPGQSGVWVEGYVVGVATATGKFCLEPPFSKNTNIVLGLRSTTSDPDYMLSVELSKGEVRDAMNLCDNPELLGKKVRLKGTLAEAYYGIPGLKDVSAWEK